MKINSLILENLQLTIIRHPLVVNSQFWLTDVVALINQVQSNFRLFSTCYAKLLAIQCNSMVKNISNNGGNSYLS